MAKPLHKPKNNPVANAVAAQAVQQQIGMVTTQTTQLYQGPIPHPDVLARFDDRVPGTAQRLINLAIEESEHRRKMEQMAMVANVETQSRNVALAEYQSHSVFRSDTISQLLGAFVTASCIIGAVYLAANGHEGIAALLCAVPTGALIQAFFIKRKP